MEVTTDKVTAMASVRFANATAKESIDWINIARSATTPDNLLAWVDKRILQGDLDHHTIVMLVSFLCDLMARQNAQYTAEKRKIDDEFNGDTFTDAQNVMLTDYLSGLYMTDYHSDHERRFALKFRKYVDLMNRCSLVANKASNFNMHLIIRHLNNVAFSADGRVAKPLYYTVQLHLLTFYQWFIRHWIVIVIVALVVPAYLPKVLALLQYMYPF